MSYQRVWGGGHVDDLVLRDSYTAGTRCLRLYAQRNAKFDVSASVSTAGIVQERDLFAPCGAVDVLNGLHVVEAMLAGPIDAGAFAEVVPGRDLDKRRPWGRPPCSPCRATIRKQRNTAAQ